MFISVKKLKQLLETCDDNMIVGSMGFAKNAEIELFAPKRILITEDAKGNKFFVINNMGTHWNEQWSKNNDMKLSEYIDLDTCKREPI